MLTAVEADQAFWDLAKVPRLPVLADLAWIQRKHPSEFKGIEDVEDHIRFVLSGDALFTFRGKSKGSLGFARLVDHRAAVVQLIPKRLDGRRVYQVLTAYTLTPGQVRRAIKEGSGAPGVNPGSSGHPEDVRPGLQGRPFEPASHRADHSTPGGRPRKVNPSAAEKRRQALRGVDASGSLEGVPKVMARRFQAKGYVKEEGGRWTLTKMGRAVMEGRIGAAGRGAVDLGGARYKAERAGGRKRAKGADLAAYMAGDGEILQRRIAKEERRYHEEEGDRLKAEWEARGAELAKEQAREARALAAVLGPSGKTHAVKIALEDRPFRRADLEALRAAGWILRPAGTVPARVGRTLPAELAWNPADELERLLGPRGEVRAVVIQSEGAFGEDLVRHLQADGYDVSPAPKGYRHGKARASNPEPSPELKRKVYEALKRLTPKGGATAEDLARKVKASPEEVEAVLARHEANGLAHRRSDVHSLFGAVWEAGMDTPGFFSGEEAQRPLPMFNPSGAKTRHRATPTATGDRPIPEDGPMSKTITGRKKAAGTSKGHPTPHPVPAAPKRAKKPARPTSRPRKGNPASELGKMTALLQRITGPGVNIEAGRGGTFVLEGKRAAVKRAAELLTKAKPKAGRWILESLQNIEDPEIRAQGVEAMAWLRLEDAPAHRLNPSDAEGLAKVWKAWTGTDPGQSLRVQVEEPRRYGLPPHVVLLGRVAWFATKSGEVKRFGVSGPYMVTDAQAKKVWLVSHKRHRFDLEPALIGYTARKPKFGDKATVEYVHAFEGRAHAVMDGQVGALTGTFRITPAGLEG